MQTYFSLALYICYAFEKIQKYAKDFVVISSTNPHETSLIHLGNHGVYKGLLHALTATVISTKVS